MTDYTLEVRNSKMWCAQQKEECLQSTIFISTAAKIEKQGYLSPKVHHHHLNLVPSSWGRLKDSKNINEKKTYNRQLKSFNLGDIFGHPARVELITFTV